MLTELQALPVGGRVTFAEEKRCYTVRARSERYLVCTKPLPIHRTVLYTVVDLEEGVRGTENLVFGMGAESDEDCRSMVDRLEGRDTFCDFRTEVSHRNRVRLNVLKVMAPKP